jgi:hypothetical protein
VTTPQKTAAKPAEPKQEVAAKDWHATLKTSNGTVSIKRSKKSAPYAIQQNN